MADYDPAKYEPNKQRPLLSKAERVAMELADRAERLLRESAKSNAARKHKWATGKEKWEALQLEGAKAAGVVGRKRGRPAAPPPSPEDLLKRFMDRLALYQGWVIEGTYGPMQLVPEQQNLRAQYQRLLDLGLVYPELEQLAEVIINQ
jgi:hypothetical protein